MLQSEVKGNLLVTGDLNVGGTWPGANVVVGYNNFGLGDQVVADTTLTYIDGINGKDFPDTPDGVKTYLMTATVNFIHTGANGYCLVYAFYGTGFGLDVEVGMRVWQYVPAGEQGNIKISGIASAPAVDDKASIAIQAENGGVTIEGGATEIGLGATLIIERLT